MRMQVVQSPIIPVIGELIRSTPGAISLGQGVVWYGPPPQAIERIDSFLANPENHKYGAVYGIPRLIELIAEKLQRENGIDCAGRRRIVVTAGGNMAFANALMAIADPGDEIILNLPYYFNHEMMITMASCKPVLVPTDNRYQPQPDLIAEAMTERTRAVVTISPNNPTGAVYTESLLREVNDVCRSRGIYHISDEAYEYFTYDGVRHFSAGSIAGSDPYTISLYSLSKAYGFAGWRIGYMVIPEHLFEAVNKIQDTILICPPVISQSVACGALEAGAGYCREKLVALSEVRELVMNELDRIEHCCDIPTADGAFYLLIKPETRMTPLAMVERLVREYGVAVIPGSAFGMSDGCYLRIAYGALQKETVAEGIGRLARGIKSILGA